MCISPRSNVSCHWVWIIISYRAYLIVTLNLCSYIRIMSAILWFSRTHCLRVSSSIHLFSEYRIKRHTCKSAEWISANKLNLHMPNELKLFFTYFLSCQHGKLRCGGNYSIQRFRMWTRNRHTHRRYRSPVLSTKYATIKCRPNICKNNVHKVYMAALLLMLGNHIWTGCRPTEKNSCIGQLHYVTPTSIVF